MCNELPVQPCCCWSSFSFSIDMDAHNPFMASDDYATPPSHSNNRSNNYDDSYYYGQTDGFGQIQGKLVISFFSSLYWMTTNVLKSAYNDIAVLSEIHDGWDFMLKEDVSGWWCSEDNDAP